MALHIGSILCTVVPAVSFVHLLQQRAAKMFTKRNKPKKKNQKKIVVDLTQVSIADWFQPCKPVQAVAHLLLP